MFGRNIRVARIAGIPIGISPWWLVIVALFTWTLGSSYYPEQVHGISTALAYALGLGSVLVLFASLLLHELGHAIVARRHGVEVQEIDLWLLGGVAKMRGEAHEPGDELRYALAGPAVTAVVTAFFGVIALLLPSSAAASVRAFVDYQLLINALILGFNLVPAFPLDGGRVLRAILWWRMGAMQPATELAARIGRAFGYLLAGLGLVLALGGNGYDGLWLVFVGIFVAMAAGQQAAGAEIRAVFAGEHAADLMTTPVVAIPGEVTADRAASEYFGRYEHTAFPVVEEHGRALGILTIDAVRAALAQGPRVASGTSGAGSEPRVAEIADRDPGLLVPEGIDLATLLEQPDFARVGRAVVVDGDRRPVGIVSITDVQRAIRSARLRAAQRPSQPSTRAG